MPLSISWLTLAPYAPSAFEKTRSAAVSKVAAVQGLMRERVDAHEVQLCRFIGDRGEEGGFGNHARLQRKQVTEDARQRDDDIDTRTTEFGKRDQLSTRQAAIAVEMRPCADERHRLRNLRAFGLQIVGTPEYHRQRLRERRTIGHVPLYQLACLRAAVGDGEAAGNTERVEAVDIAAGRQNVGIAQNIAAREPAT